METFVTRPKRILLSGDNYYLIEEIAGGTIKPGHLCEIYNDSGDMLVRVHGTAKGFGENMFALEDPLQGQTVDSVKTRNIDISYVVTERVPLAICGPGTMAFIFLKAGTAYVIGDKLESAGDGSLQKASGSADLKIFATLLEAKDLSASGAVATRAIVRVN